MKKYFLVTLIIPVVLLVLPATIYAQAANPVSKKGLEKVETSPASTRAQLVTEKKEARIEKTRNSAQAQLNVVNQAIKRLEIILNKLQEKIGRAVASGNNVSQIDILMNDARAKINDAKAKTTELEKLKNSAKTKTDFLSYRTKFKSVLEDLKTAKKDISQIITILKGFNSATSSQPKADRPLDNTSKK